MQAGREMSGKVPPRAGSFASGGLGRHEAAEAQSLAAIRIDRACAELRRGRPLALHAANTVAAHLKGKAEAGGVPAGWLLVAAVETLDEASLHGLLQRGSGAQLLLSAERLRALGWPDASTERALALQHPVTLVQLQQLAAAAPGPAERSLLRDTHAGTARDPALPAALALCKRARLLPALLLLPLPADQASALEATEVLRLDAADLALAASARPGSLRRVSDAKVPLAAHEDCTLVLFRETAGDAEHLAIVVGEPPAHEPVPVRLHSACLTGDLLGSLRCDCGPQLQRAVTRLAETGGVLLYLAQEGRGTGLANKLRAYRLQDAGLDTLQADRHLGFREDERTFEAAAQMLRALGHNRIKLLTNNPLKIAALSAAGIEVVERMPLHAPVNGHNARYIQTKAG
jgi:GTP cyclohydrolase II